MAETPPLPTGFEIELVDRGALYVRDLGPRDAPTLILLHGWTATADLNWFTCYSRLADRYRVIAFDHRGHGRGLRSRRSFQLTDCADDAAAVADALGVDEFIPVGYSMGGTIAQLLWKRHRERVRGLVLASTAPYFAGRRHERWSFAGLTGLAALARLTPEQARDWITDQVYLQRKTESWEPWALDEAASHDWRMVLEAGKDIGNFSSSEWITGVDVPTSVIVTMDDHVVPTHRQAKLFDLIPGADVYRVNGDHDAVAAKAAIYVPTLLRAVGSVVERIERAGDGRSDVDSDGDSDERTLARRHQTSLPTPGAAPAEKGGGR